MSSKLISGGATLSLFNDSSKESLTSNNFISVVIDGLKSVFNDKDVIKRINMLNSWSDIYDFISYHISILSEKREFDKVKSLKI